MKKRILAALLFVAMLLTLLPTAALADDADVQPEAAEAVLSAEPADDEADASAAEAEPSEEPEALAADDTAVLSDDDADIIASGTCGDNLTWVIRRGEGVNSVMTVSGTGDIPDYNSGDAPWRTYDPRIVVIEDGVTGIGENAFWGSTSLNTVTIPGSVKSIGKEAFACCYYLTTVNLGDGIESIGDAAFRRCGIYNSRGAHTVTIPDSVTSIGEYAFAYCSKLTSVTIGSGVTSIGDGAFDECTALTSVTIPDSVTTIGERAFYSCSGLTNVTIGNSVESIGSAAFYGCSSLTEVTIPDSVTSIGDSAYNGCTGLTGVKIGDGVKTIGQTAFARCSSLTDLTIGNNVETIGDSAFSDCSSLTGNVQLENATSIGSAAFQNCSSLTDVELGSGLTSIGTSAFSGCSSLTGVTIPDSVTTLGANAFNGCSSMTSAVIGNGVTGIGTSTFKGCSSLTEVTIPDSVTSIDAWAFGGCSSLTSVTIPDCVTSIGQFVFSGCTSMTSVTIGNGVTNIGACAFDGCTSLKDVYISDLDAWFGINFEHYEGNPFCCASNLYLNGELVTELVVPDGVSKINDYAFYQCECLTSVTIPDGVAVGTQAFSGCTGLTNVTTGSGSLGALAFENCTALKTIKFEGAAPKAAIRYTWIYDVDVSTIDWSTVTQEWLAEHETSVEHGPFDGVTATAYYPSGDDTWTAAVMEKIGTGANLTWIPYETHKWDDGRITTEPTCTEAGEMLYTCTDCGAAKTAVIPALGHDYSYVDNGDGTHTATCSRCGNVVTEEHNYVNLVCACGAVDTGVHIVTQPNGGEATFGQTVTISVEAVNAKAYQWYYSKDGGENWTKLYWTGAKTDTLTVEYKASRAAFQYKCRVKGNDGTILYTEPTSISQGVAPDGEITKQPGTVCGNVGDTVSFSITAENAISYQWYYSKDDGSTWTKLYWNGYDTDTLTFEVKKSRYSYVYYCKITDGNGNAAYSTRGYLRQPFSLKAQPQDTTAAIGSSVNLTVSAVGVQSYQWYYSSDNGESWKKLSWTGAKSDTLSVEVTQTRCSYLYHCVLVGYDGTEVTTNNVQITAAG